MGADRDRVTATLKDAVSAYRAKRPRPTLLSSPGPDILDPLSAAIRKCRAFEVVAGHVLFSGGSGPVLDAPLLSTHLFQRAESNEEYESAVEWLFRLLSTREARGSFTAAVWGLSIDKETQLTEFSRIVSFDQLPKSFMKSRIIERARTCYDGSAWLSHTYFDAPRVALLVDVPAFPYIGTDGACFQKIAQLECETRDVWVTIEAASVGHPLAIGCWFEYADQELDLANWQNTVTWILPEIPPRISAFTPASGARIFEDLRAYKSLPDNHRSDLLRSMKRFTLSQCRYEIIDRILDLTLAFEIAVSGKSDQAPPSWKVSVRSAQLIGGALPMRQANRKKINDLYRLRNRATHGANLKGREMTTQQEIVRDCSELYQKLIQSFLALGAVPDWDAIELESRPMA